MKTDLENKIQKYLNNKDNWKLFINEKLNDWENASLNGSIDTTIYNKSENPCCFDVRFSYKITDAIFDDVSESGIAIYSNDKKTNEIIIESIKKI